MDIFSYIIGYKKGQQSRSRVVEQTIDVYSAPSGTLDSSGNVVASNTLVVTDFIDISSAIAVYRYGSTAGTTFYRYAVYDANKQLLQYTNNTTDYQYETIGDRQNCTRYNIDVDGAKYIRISTNTSYSDLKYAMLVTS